MDFGSFPAALEFVSTVGRLALPVDHQPDIDIRGSHVHLALTSRADGGVREADLLLANEISALVVYLGHVPDHERLTAVEIAIDAMDREAIAPFWAAVLGLEPDGEGDVTVPHDEAPRRVAAALAAGGRLVSDDAAPAFWVLADAEGNEACVSTWQGRD